MKRFAPAKRIIKQNTSSININKSSEQQNQLKTNNSVTTNKFKGFINPHGMTGPTGLCLTIVDCLDGLQTDSTNCIYCGVYDSCLVTFLQSPITGTYSIATALGSPLDIVSIQTFNSDITYALALNNLNITIANNQIKVISSPNTIDTIYYFNSMGKVIASFQLFTSQCCPTGISSSSEIFTRISPGQLGWVSANCFLKPEIDLPTEIGALPPCQPVQSCITFNTTEPFLNNNAMIFPPPWQIASIIILGVDYTSSYTGSFNTYTQLGNILIANGWTQVGSNSPIYQLCVYSSTVPTNTTTTIKIIDINSSQIFFCTSIPPVITQLAEQSINDLQIIIKDPIGTFLCNPTVILDSIPLCDGMEFNCTTCIISNYVLDNLKIPSPWKITQLILGSQTQTPVPTLFNTLKQFQSLLINLGWSYTGGGVFSISQILSAPNSTSSITITGSNTISQTINLKSTCQVNCGNVSDNRVILSRDDEGNYCWVSPGCFNSTPACLVCCKSSKQCNHKNKNKHNRRSRNRSNSRSRNRSNSRSRSRSQSRSNSRSRSNSISRSNSRHRSRSFSRCIPIGCTGYGCTGLNLIDCGITPLYNLQITVTKDLVRCINAHFDDVGPYWISSYKLANGGNITVDQEIDQPFSLITLVNALILIGWTNSNTVSNNEYSVTLMLSGSVNYISGICINLLGNDGSSLPFNYTIPIDSVTSISCPGLTSETKVLIQNPGQTGICLVDLGCLQNQNPMDITTELNGLDECSDTPTYKICMKLDECDVTKLSETFGSTSNLEIVEYLLVGDQKLKLHPPYVLGNNVTLTTLVNAFLTLGWTSPNVSASPVELDYITDKNISYIVINIVGANSDIPPYPYLIGADCSQVIGCPSLDPANMILIRKPGGNICWTPICTCCGNTGLTGLNEHMSFNETSESLTKLHSSVSMIQSSVLISNVDITYVNNYTIPATNTTNNMIINGIYSQIVNKIDLLLNVPLILPSTSDNFTVNLNITFTSPLLPIALSYIQPIFQITLVGTHTNSIINNLVFNSVDRILLISIANIDGSITQSSFSVNIGVSYMI